MFDSRGCSTTVPRHTSLTGGIISGVLMKMIHLMVAKRGPFKIFGGVSLFNSRYATAQKGVEKHWSIESLFRSSTSSSFPEPSLPFPLASCYFIKHVMLHVFFFFFFFWLVFDCLLIIIYLFIYFCINFCLSSFKRWII